MKGNGWGSLGISNSPFMTSESSVTPRSCSCRLLTSLWFACVRADSDTNTFYFANGDTTKPIIRNEWAFGYVQPALDPVQVRRRLR